jgi:hypothetical protein
MRHASIFLTLDRVAFGVDKLLEFMADRAALESRRPPTPPGGALATRSLITEEFGDGMTFQLTICSRTPPTSVVNNANPHIRRLLATLTAPPLDPVSKLDDLGIEILWSFVELPPQELLLASGDEPNPELDTFLKTAESWAFGVNVCERCAPWIAPKRNSELRKVRSVLDRYAKPRLVLPEKDAENFREDFIALIALFAAKAQHLAPRDDALPRFFRSYCDRFFGPVRDRRKLSEAEWHGAVDRVFQRLYGGKVGMGFTMPALPMSFRAYLARAVRGQAASETSGRRPIARPSRFPSIEEAAASLGVSHMTVRRWLRRLGFREWTEETWRAIFSKINLKKQWQQFEARLRESGLGDHAARKRVQRFKLEGLTPDAARRRHLSSVKSRKGNCTACGESQIPGELHEGKFYCLDCYREKKGIFAAE